MSGVTWRNVATQAKAEDALVFLNKADIGSVIFGMDEMIIKDGIFSAMKKFSDNSDIQNRSLQLLQDCQILSPKGITNDEIAFRFDVLLQTLSNCIDRTDVLCNLFEFLAMVADKKAVKERCIRTEDTELLHLVGHSLEIHQKSKDVQRSGLQLYEAILNNASEKSQKTFAKKMFRAVGENLQKNNDDPAICYSSYSILCTLADKMGDKLAPWIERILGMILTSISQLFSGELVAKCMVLLEKLATDQDALYAMASHPRSLRVFTDALGILDISHLSASITALEYLLRILEDDNAVQLVMENIIEQHIKPLRYFKTVKLEVDTKADKFAKLVAEAHNVDEGAMQYWLQLLDFINNILNDMIRELEAEYPETESDTEHDALQGSAKPAAAAVSINATTSASASGPAAADTRKPSSATAGVVPLVDNPLARKTAPKYDDSVALAASIAAEQARVAQALQAVSAAEQQRNAGTSSPALIPIDSHKRRSFVYEEPEDTNSAGVMAESDSAAGSRKERVVGTSFPSLSAVAAITTQPAKSIIASTSPSTSALQITASAVAAAVPMSAGSAKGNANAQVPVAAVAIPIGIPGNSPTPPGPKSDIPVVMAMAADRAGANVDSFGSTKNAQLLAGVRWENLELQFDVMVVEAFLNICDLGTAILTMDTAMVKGALFSAMRNFPDDSAIQTKCIQLLQECQLLSPKGVSNEELSQHFDLLLHVVSDFTDQPALIAVLFEFLTMVADRKPVKERCSRTEDTELLHFVGKALEFHRPDKSVQRAGLQLYEAILQHASEKSQKTFAKKIFRAVGENLQKNNDDPAICYSSYSILCTLTDKMGDKLAPWIERILGLVLTSITQLYSAELVAKCLLLLEKIATDHDSLFVMAAHPRCLRVFTDALGILDTRYMSATITALEYLLRILEDDTSMSVVLENLDGQKLAHLEYFRKLQDELGSKSDKFLDLAAQANDVDDGAMQYWLQLLEQINNIIVEYMRELGKGTEAVHQAATTPGLLPTIEEHGSESEDESIEAFDEKKDDCAPGFIHGHTAVEVENAPVEQEEPDGEDLEAAEEAAERARLEEEEDARIAAEQAEAEAARVAAEEAAEEAQAEAACIAAAKAEALAEATALAEARAEEQRRLQVAKEEAVQREKRAAEAVEAAARLEQERRTTERAEAARIQAIAAEEERVAELARQAESALLEAQQQAEAAALETERLAAEAEEEALIRAAEAELRAEDAAAASEEAARVAEEEAADAEALALAEEEAQLLAEEEALEAECAAIAAAEAQKQAELAALEGERLAAAQAEALRVAEEEALQAEYAAITAAEAKQRAEAAQLEAERRAAEEALSKEEELLQLENQKIVSAQRAAAAEKLRLATIQREAEETAARVEAERLTAIAQAEADRLATEEQERATEAARLEAERAAVAAQVEQERLEAECAREEARLLAEHTAEEERQLQATREAEELAARTKAERLAAEKLVAEQQVAKLAKERAAARVAAEKEAQRERAAQQAAERAARLAAAEEAKKAVETKRAERLAAEKAAALAAEEKRVAQQREREAKAAAEKASRIAAAQQALLEAKEKLEREHAEKVAAERAIAQAAEERLLEIQRAREEQALAAQRAKEEKAAADKAERIALAQQAVAEAKEKRAREMARKEAAAHTAMAAVSFSVHASRHAELSHECKQSSSSSSSGSHVACAIASELLHSPVPVSSAGTPAASEPAIDERKGLKRGESWRAANVPFVSSTVNARIAAEKEAEESRRVQELQKVADDARRQALEAMQRAEDMHRLYLGAEKKMENLTVENSELAQRAIKKEAPQLSSDNVAVPVDKRAQSLGQGRYASVLLTSAAAKQPSSPPSPIRKSLTPAGVGHHTHDSMQSTGVLQMELETLDLRSPHGDVRQHSLPSQSQQSPHPQAAHPMRSSVPAGSSPQRQRSSTREVSRSRSPVRRSQSVPDMHADKDEVRVVDPDEVARREARAERLRKIVYPINGRSTERLSTLAAQEEKVSKQALAVAGVLEAFAQLTVPSANAITGFGSASVKVSHGSLRHPHSRNNSPTANLLHATGIYGSFASPQGGGNDSHHSVRFQEAQSPELPQCSSATPLRRSLTAMEAQYNEVVHASEGVVMQECGQNIAILFRRLKETTKNNFNGKTDAVIGLPLMKLCIRRLGLVDAKTFPNNEADILLFHLGVKQLTLFGFALAVTLCAERALHSPLEGELGASTYIPKSYMGVVEFLNQKMLKLFARMDSEHVQKTTSFNPLDDYREIPPESQHEVMKLLEREKKVFYTIYESYLPKSVKGFSDMKAALCAAPLTGGLPFSGVVNFGRDFEMSPHLLSRAQLLEIFNSILLAERELVQQQHTFSSPDAARHSNSISNGALGTSTPGSSGKLQVETSSSWAGMGRDLSQKSANSAFSATSMAPKADPADSISFPQFLDFILLVALRCPMFRGTASPVVKLSNLMLLLNQSQGKHILAKKFRSKEVVVFRVNPVFAMATSYRAAQDAAISSPLPTAGAFHGAGSAGADAGDEGTYAWGDDAGTESILDGERQLLKQPTRSHSPSRTEIRISPTSKAFKPSTVPFYDTATQSVVQIRRKKPMAELRGKLSDSH